MLLSLLPAVAQTGVGLFQSLFSGRKKAEKALENLKTPTVENNTAINRYYNDALQRYNVNPYDSSMYRMQQQQAGRNFNTGMNSLQGRRMGLAGVNSLTQGMNDASLNAGVQAEGQRDRRFGDLGNATNMKYADDQYVFDINKMMPFQKQMQLLSMKSAAANDRFSSGIKNMFGGLSNASSILGSRDQNNNTSNGGGSQHTTIAPASTYLGGRQAKYNPITKQWGF